MTKKGPTSAFPESNPGDKALSEDGKSVPSGWEDRLAKARMKRAQALADHDAGNEADAQAGPSSRDPSVEGLVNLDEILQTPNSNDRLELARKRHVQVRARRNPPAGDAAQAAEPEPHKKTILVAFSSLGAGRSERPVSTQNAGTSQPDQAVAAVAGRAKPRRYGMLAVAAGVAAFALFVVLAPAQFRYYATLSVDTVADFFDPPTSLVAQGGDPAVGAVDQSDPQAPLPVANAVLSGFRDISQQLRQPPVVPDASGFTAPRSGAILVRMPAPEAMSAQELSDRPVGEAPQSYAFVAEPNAGAGAASVARLATQSPVAAALTQQNPVLMDVFTQQLAQPEIPLKPGLLQNLERVARAENISGPGLPLAVTLRDFSPFELPEQAISGLDALNGDPSPDGVRLAFLSAGTRQLPAVPDLISFQQNAASGSVFDLEFQRPATISDAVLVMVPAQLVRFSPDVAEFDADLPHARPGLSPVRVALSAVPFETVIPGAFDARLPQPSSSAARLVYSGQLPEPPELSEVSVLQTPPRPFADISRGVAVENYSVIVHAPRSLPRRSLGEFVESLQATGYAIGSPRRVNFKIRDSNVRYFFAADAEAARELAAVVGGSARDFTSYRPSPPPGTIEVWLAGPEVRRAARRVAPRAAPAEDAEIILLRDRLVDILRNGDRF